MSWDRIHGHDAVRDQFQSAARRGRLGQAFLFVGPEGVGKAHFARELAKALLCERPPTPLTPCDVCQACQQVAVETHPDLLRLRTPEGKHELPIAEMREFCSLLARTPARGGRRIGIVEDADQFNLESANAFLKSLEEPPRGTILILIATGTDRQLPTILSRCQVVRFNPLAAADLDAILVEKGVSDPKLRSRLVTLSRGSVARALALNSEEVWKFREDLLAGMTAERPDFTKLAKLCLEFVEGAGKESLGQRHRASVAVGFLIDCLRQALRLLVEASVTGIEPEESRKLQNFAMRIGPDRVIELIEKCVEADYRIERRVQLILVIESLLEQFCKSARV
jgi:DNA polymerase-3 subunit delta'